MPQQSQPRRRVMFLINSLARGGAETQLVELARVTRAAGHDVAILTLLDDNDFRDTLDRLGVDATSLGLRGLSSVPGVMWRGYRALRRWRPDLTIGFLYQATMLMRLLNVVVRPDRSISSMRNERLETQARSISYFVTSFLDNAVVANSETALERLVESRTVPRSRATVIYNGIDPARFSTDREAKRARARSELGVPTDGFFFLGLGRLSPQKRWDLFIDAVSRYTGPAPITVAIAGEGPLAAELRQQIGQRGLTDRVALLGLRHDVDELMAAADCLVLTSSHEGTPNVVLEAQAAGLRIIATRVGACAELLAGTDGLLVEPGRPDDLAAAMSKVAVVGPANGTPSNGSSPDGFRTEAQSLSRFSWDTVGSHWLTLMNGGPMGLPERQ